MIESGRISDAVLSFFISCEIKKGGSLYPLTEKETYDLIAEAL